VAILSEEITSLRAENATLRRMGDGRSGDNEELSAKVRSQQELLVQNEREIQRMRARLAELEEFHRTADDAQQRLHDEMEHRQAQWASEASRLNKELTAKRERLRKAEEDLERLRAEANEDREQSRRLQKELETLRNNGHGDAATRQELDVLREAESLRTSVTDLKQAGRLALAERDEAKHRLAERENEWKRKEGETEAWRLQKMEELATVRAEAERLREQLREAQEHVDRSRADIDTNNALVVRLLEEFNAIRQSFDQQSSQKATVSTDGLEAMLSKKFDTITKDLKRRLEGLGLKETPAGTAEDAKAAVASLYNHEVELESNLNSIGVKNQKGGSILQNLEKMKSLRGLADGNPSEKQSSS
jgi:chromosome segregation ATPase